MAYFLAIYTLLILLYAFLIFRYFIAWINMPLFSLGALADFPEVDVIIPYRNEVGYLTALIEGLKKQTYSQNKTIYYLIDDHSDDGSHLQLKKLIGEDERFVLLSLPEGENGKKMALQRGVSNSKGVILIFSDADCIHSKNWLSQMVAKFQVEECDMVLGSVAYRTSNSFMGKFAAFEFAGLIGTAAASVSLGKPVLSNGANIAVKRAEVSENKDVFNSKYASGDDMFLMSKLAKDPKKKICFVKDTATIVETDPPKNLKAFVKQRLRWVSKNKAIPNKKMQYDAAVVLLANLVLLIALLGISFNSQFALIFAIGYSLKMVVDLLFSLPVLGFFGKTNLLPLLPVFELFNIIYVPVIAIWGSFAKFEWKKRKHKK